MESEILKARSKIIHFAGQHLTVWVYNACQCRGGSRISGKGVQIHVKEGVRFADFI